MFQLSLEYRNSRESMVEVLEEMTGKAVSLTITDNSASVLSIKKKGGIVGVRMHWMFLSAGEDVIREIASYMTRRTGTPLLRRYINENRSCLRKKDRSRRRSALCSQGRFFDLQELFDEINEEYFEGAVGSRIGWGKGNSRRVVRKRTLGTYCNDSDEIRISSFLDRRAVPRYFIRYVVYHEMLHSFLGETRSNGRRSVHNPEFRRRERMFKEYERAVLWEKSQGA